MTNKYTIVLKPKVSKKDGTFTTGSIYKLDADTVPFWQVNCLRRYNKLPGLNEQQVDENVELLGCHKDSPHTIIKENGIFKVVKNDPKYGKQRTTTPKGTAAADKDDTPSKFNVAAWMKNYTKRTGKTGSRTVVPSPIPQYNDTVYNEIFRRIRCHLALMKRFNIQRTLAIDLTGATGFTHEKADEIAFTMQYAQDLIESNADELITFIS